MLKVLDTQMALGLTRIPLCERKALRKSAKSFPFMSPVLSEVKQLDLSVLEQEVISREMDERFVTASQESRRYEDLHLKKACEWFNCKPEEVTSEMREIGKKMNYIELYSTVLQGTISNA